MRFRLFRPRVEYTNVDPKVVGFFFQQYVELMKHGRDDCDVAMKMYVAEVITQLGVPDTIIEPEPVAELPAPLPELPRSNPVIVRTPEQRRELERQREMESKKKYGTDITFERERATTQRDSRLPNRFGGYGNSSEDCGEDCEGFEEEDIEDS